MNGGLEIKTKADIGTRYRVHLMLPVEESDAHPDDQEKILEGTQALLDISNEEVRGIISTRLSQLGAQITYPDEHLLTQQHDLLLTDEITRMEDYALLLQADEPDITALTPCRLRVNYNLGGPLLDAMLQLLELRLSQEESDDAAQTALAQDDEGVLEQLRASGYLTLFAETVPDDVKRLYTEASAGDLQALAQTAHRLKGVFAMLNLVSGTLLCETLEQHIKQAIIEYDNSKIGNDIQQIDVFVIKLLQHARSITL
jgi:two-component system sensor histidine kinase RcsD